MGPNKKLSFASIKTVVGLLSVSLASGFIKEAKRGKRGKRGQKRQK